MLTLRRARAVVAVGLAALLAGPAFACTTVCLLDGGRPFVAYNYDFDPPEGLILVNKRDTSRRSALRSPAAAAWTSTYGSVTFNQFGRDNPTTGVNEKGLMVSLMWLSETRYPDTDGRPAFGVLEWIQHSLDRHATVAEALAGADAVRLADQAPIHYLFADATGEVAVVEFLGGQLAIRRGADLPIRALANSTYADSLAAMDAAARRGDVPRSVSSLDRFARAAAMARSAGPDPIGRGFEILASVAQPDFTRWSVVYDLGAREIHYRTDGNRAIRHIPLAGLDLSCATPVAMLDVAAGSAGDVTRDFAAYTRAANRALIEASFSKTAFLQAVPPAARDAAAVHPDKTSACAPSK